VGTATIKGVLLELLRTDPEVQGAVLALLAGAIAGPQAPAGAPQAPVTRQKPDWVLRQLAEAGKP